MHAGSTGSGHFVKMVHNAIEFGMLQSIGEGVELSTCVEDTGEVKWIVEWALEHDVPAPVVMLAQSMLMQYRDEHREPATPMAKAVALMRHGFDGHPLHRG